MAARISNASHRGAVGRTRARRLLAWAPCLLAAALVWPSLALAGGPQVDVQEDDGMYRVTATFRVPQPAAVVAAVLTDYEQIPRFMPDVRTSRVLEEGDGRIVVEQEAVARFMMFSRRIHLVLEIREEPGTIHFRDLCGKSFVRYEGAWTIADIGRGTAAIRYQLTAQPSFGVPEFLLKRLLERDATRMIASLQAEVAARGEPDR